MICVWDRFHRCLHRNIAANIDRAAADHEMELDSLGVMIGPHAQEGLHEASFSDLK